MKAATQIRLHLPIGHSAPLATRQLFLRRFSERKNPN